MSNIYNEVKFVTTSSVSVPSYLSQTGSIIIINDPNGLIPVSEQENIFNSYLYLRGNLIAGGIGFESFETKDKATYIANTYNDLYSKVNSTYTYITYLAETIKSYLNPISEEYINNELNWNNL